VSRMPTLNRKIRIISDWTLALFFRREIVSLGSLQRPREEFERTMPRRRPDHLPGQLPGQLPLPERAETPDPSGRTQTRHIRMP
jgi:hypothetical protein